MITILLTKRISALSQWNTFRPMGVLLTRWRRKPPGIEITSLLPYVLQKRRLRHVPGLHEHVLQTCRQRITRRPQ